MMALMQAVFLLAGLALPVSGQTFIVSDCRDVSGQQVCLGPDGSSVTFSSTAAPASTAPVTTAPATTAGPTTSAAVASTAATTATPTSVTAITGCHYHGTAPYCFAGTAEYEILKTYTRTSELPAQFTGCHAHAADMYCIAPNGGEVRVRAEGAAAGTGTATSIANSASTSGSSEEGMDCHFHAGVEHCIPIGSSESGATAVTCDRVDREYNIPIRVGMLFVILVTSSIGVFAPILTSSFLHNRITSLILLLLKNFGTGIMVSTAFVHLYTHAELMFTSQCITWPVRYEGTTAAVVTAGIFIAFIVEYIGSRIVQRTLRRSATPDSEDGLSSDADAEATRGKTDAGAAQAKVQRAGHVSLCGGGGGAMNASSPKQQKLAVMVMEAGIIFHSILIGLTLVVAGDSVFRTLAVVIVFHQLFEGLALGTRIAQIPSTSTSTSSSSPRRLVASKILMALAFALITPLGMAIGLGALNRFDGNDPATLITIGTLDALSAGVLAWVALVEMWAGDWLGGEMATAGVGKVVLGLGGLVAGIVAMSVLGKWA